MLCFTICRNFQNAYFMELLATGFYWLPGFSNKINTTHYSIVESCSIVNQNIVKSKVKFEINDASMNDYNYGKFRQIMPIFESGLTANLLKKFCNNSKCDRLY